uniref:EEF1A lysine and N-terminal methyltransferase n=1 Tax=Elaeis guineensis var. tenera TaxID=51953 RepID=A0A6I9SBV9_ELAGV|nr:eEF1A lysine and N-terminal methyltransferase [Elaeis guineensis]
MDSGIEPGALERLSPFCFLSFSFPNPHPGPYGDPLRVAVLDSPLPPPPSQPPAIAAMLVPLGREHDWIFSTPAGHLQLLLSSSPLSRLVLVGDQPSPFPQPYSRPGPNPDRGSLLRFQQSLLPLLLAVSPRAAFRHGIPEIPFLSFEDEVLSGVPVEALEGPAVGEMLVEDVEIDRSPAPPERRRRLRFQRKPNLVQTQVRLLPHSSNVGIFRPETGSLVQPYLGPMVAGLSLIAPSIGERVRSGSMPRALCVGVGGGALLMCLRSKLGFDVLGVEADDVVLDVARRRFGLVEDDFLKVCVGDGIGLIESFARERTTACGGLEDGQVLDRIGGAVIEKLGDPSSGFDAIMVDLDSGDAMSGIGAPPLEFVRKDVLSAARSVLHDHGIVVVNVIPPDGCFYKGLIDAFRQVFAELYELDAGNGENHVLVASASPVGAAASDTGDSFSEKLNQVVDERYISGIKKI